MKTGSEEEVRNFLDLAPIALFAYNRFEHLKKTVDALILNSESKSSKLYIFLDGPKSSNDRDKIDHIFEYVSSINGFKSISITKSNLNRGLAQSITLGISKILSIHDKVIVLEDDIVVSKYFLEFMNTGLNLYKDDINVASIHGYVYPISNKLPETFFLRGSDCWGWATWDRAWKKYNDDGKALLDKLRSHNESYLFDFDGYGGYLKMLESSNRGEIDSWAIKWYASTFLEGMYTLYPGKSIVKNIGMDGSGTHRGFLRQSFSEITDTRISVKRISPSDSLEAREEFVKYFKSIKTWKFFDLINKTLQVISRYNA